MRTPLLVALTVFVLAFVFVNAAIAEDAAPAEPPVQAEPVVVTPAPPAAPETAPTVAAPAFAPDADIFKRTPRIDGVVEPGEWDVFYTADSGGSQLTTYADWDRKNIYAAVASDKPVDLVVAIDAHTDGWFHGQDNYEVKVVRSGEQGHTLTVSRYQSRGTTSPEPVPVTEAEAGYVQMKSGTADGKYSIEVCIPAKLIRGLKLEPGRKTGLQVAVKTSSDESGWFPEAAPGKTETCTLVDKKFAKLKPLELGFDLRDNMIARGDELAAKFHITNTGSETVDAASFVIAGEGKAGEYLSSQKVRMQPLPPRKHIAQDFSSLIPKDMPLGAWALGAEVKSDTERLGGALVSFEVVEPFEIELRVPEKPVRVDVKDVTFSVLIRSYMRHSARGTAKITLPVGWELWRGKDTKEFNAQGKTGGSVDFEAKPPLGALGKIPVKVEVTIGDLTKTAEETFELINP